MSFFRLTSWPLVSLSPPGFLLTSSLCHPASLHLFLLHQLVLILLVSLSVSLYPLFLTLSLSPFLSLFPSGSPDSNRLLLLLIHSKVGSSLREDFRQLNFVFKSSSCVTRHYEWHQTRLPLCLHLFYWIHSIFIIFISAGKTHWSFGPKVKHDAKECSDQFCMLLSHIWGSKWFIGTRMMIVSGPRNVQVQHMNVCNITDGAVWTRVNRSWGDCVTEIVLVKTSWMGWECWCQRLLLGVNLYGQPEGLSDKDRWRQFQREPWLIPPNNYVSWLYFGKRTVTSWIHLTFMRSHGSSLYVCSKWSPIRILSSSVSHNWPVTHTSSTVPPHLQKSVSVSSPAQQHSLSDTDTLWDILGQLTPM